MSAHAPAIADLQARQLNTHVYCVQGDFRYQPVLMHERATSIHRTHSNANTYLEVFDVQGHPGGEVCVQELRRLWYSSL
jgi:hypothetical protein